MTTCCSDAAAITAAATAHLLLAIPHSILDEYGGKLLPPEDLAVALHLRSPQRDALALQVDHRLPQRGRQAKDLGHEAVQLVGPQHLFPASASGGGQRQDGLFVQDLGAGRDEARGEEAHSLPGTLGDGVSRVWGSCEGAVAAVGAISSFIIR